MTVDLIKVVVKNVTHKRKGLCRYDLPSEFANNRQPRAIFCRKFFFALAKKILLDCDTGTPSTPIIDTL